MMKNKTKFLVNHKKLDKFTNNNEKQYFHYVIQNLRSFISKDPAFVQSFDVQFKRRKYERMNDAIEKAMFALYNPIDFLSIFIWKQYIDFLSKYKYLYLYAVLKIF